MRVVNRLASLLLAVILLGGGLLLAAEAAAVALDLPSLLIDRAGWFNTLTSTTVGDPVIFAIAIAVGVVGLLILLTQLRPWTPQRLEVPLADGWHLHRRSVEKRLAGAADRVPGVRDARARVRRHGNSWSSRIRAIGDPATRPQVERAIRQELDRLAAPPAARLDIQLARQRRTT
ncbi:hypothetical protein BDK92_0010 [Micromonospora pisi]|uniref:DUF6286 domain-containing protein n=1 Tax=Micromonospora pisi TaxID=589240 RepID=A0A495JAQ1_9ACTN|nr:DUF6286 domain-containing protein [Micromonospora pisi]RKR85801.1 hypothetical protein BDK92_0010 [Micromonospora pisi]